MPFFFGFLLACPSSAQAQSLNSSAQSLSGNRKPLKLSYFEGQLYIGLANNFRIGTSLNAYLSNRIVLGIDFNSTTFNAVKTPGNYDPDGFFLFYSYPKDGIRSISVPIGVYWPIPGHGDRLVLEVAPGQRKYSEANFIYRPSDYYGYAGVYGAKYDVYAKYYYAWGLTAEARIDLLISNYLGAGISCFADFNKFRKSYGIKLAVTAGKIRDKKYLGK